MKNSAEDLIATSEQAFTGCLLGTAVGDALGLPYEGLSRRRGRRLLGVPDRFRFLFRRGMFSDDTEHTCMVANALLLSVDDPDVFEKTLARQLRYWLASLPAGIGFATLRAILRLWLGMPSSKSGLFSAGNGPAMRSAIIGVWTDDIDQMIELVSRSTKITHTDPKANYGAIAVALAARHAARPIPASSKEYYSQLESCLGTSAEEFLKLIQDVLASVARGESTVSYADSIDLQKGVTGYVYHTVPVAIHAWLSHQDDYRSAVMAVIECGGDTDTTAAIVGGIVGAGTGSTGIPPEWISRVCDWPLTISRIDQLGVSLHLSKTKPLAGSQNHWPHFLKRLLRNGIFTAIVLFHGIRRLFPPY